VPADVYALLFELFGAAVPAQGDVPSAPLCYLADTGEWPDGPVYHADPVHLRPDQDRLLLFDVPSEQLDPADAREFVDAVNDHFAVDGWRLSAPTPARWYLQVPELPRLHTRPLGEVIGRNVDLFLPTGDDAAAWRQRLTEVQMLFHGLPVNQRRQTRGLPAVNGVWLHGGGVAPIHATRALAVGADAPPLVRGLARSDGGEPVGSLQWLGRAQRAVWDADVGAWQQAAAEVEQRLAASTGPVWLYPGDGYRYDCRPGCRWRLWRRRRSLPEWLLPTESL
jgi:hypothetical protein